MKFDREELILDKKVRQHLIKEIESNENISRKLESFKRYEILKDRIKKYIIQNLMKELDPETVEDMQSRIATVNIYKKVVSKKARVYKIAPKRITSKKSKQDLLDEFVDKLKLNVRMKKTNKYLEALLNTDVFIRPIKESFKKTDNGTNKWSYKIDPMPSFKYDVVEDANDPEKAMGYLLSPFVAPQPLGDDDPQNRERNGLVSNFRDGDGKDQTIADSPNDEQCKEYVWWGNNYHITFDKNGEIIKEKSGDDLLNPIGKIPFVSFARDRDGAFWSVGGEDLIEGSILINTVLTDIYYIAKMHGTGLFYMFGKGVPKTYKVGANQGITMNVEEGDPTPQIGFANANPQLSEHKDLVEQYLAILLTTNDIEPGAVSGELTASSASSGIQEIIVKSEPMNAIEDDQEIFKDNEPEIVEIARLWHNLYLDKGLLVDDLAELGKIENIDYSIKFGATAQFVNEKEKLDVIEKRMSLELDDLADAMILDNPDLSRKEALKIIEERSREKLEKQKQALSEMIEDGREGDENNQPEKEDEENTEESEE